METLVEIIGWVVFAALIGTLLVLLYALMTMAHKQVPPVMSDYWALRAPYKIEPTSKEDVATLPDVSPRTIPPFDMGEAMVTLEQTYLFCTQLRTNNLLDEVRRKDLQKGIEGLLWPAGKEQSA